MNELNSVLHLDLYEILEVSKSADYAEIKSAYRKLVRKFHPDINPSFEEKFKLIKSAYEILIDDETKSKYDRFKNFSSPKSFKYNDSKKNNRQETYNRQKQSQAQKAYSENVFTSAESNNKKNRKFKNNTTEKPFAQVFDNILNEVFKATSKIKDATSNKSKNGTDISLNIELTPLEVIQGTNRKVNVLHTQICPKCQGRKIINNETCSFCNGKGELQTHKKINVKIPANIKAGSKIRISNEGNQGQNGGKNGDLYLIINIKNPNTKDQSNNNIESETKDSNTNDTKINKQLFKIPITPYEAVLGSTIELETTNNNKINLTIPANTISGTKFNIQDKNNSSNNDIIIEVFISIPSQHSIEEIKLYQELKNLSGQDIRQGFKIINNEK